MAGRAAGLVLAAALTSAGCGATVAKLPATTALRDQTATQQRLDTIDCKAEVGYRMDYNGDDSEVANVLRHVFVLGTAGASLGLVSTATASSTVASDSLIAGGSAGTAAGIAIGLTGRSRFEREWIACMESRGYAIVAPSSAIH
ncbi:MAG TPA: hypothetical protein VEH80_06240 [Candidatus Bathyarchaeia archaeon]|nr:hypothetical protein [Candidatus Bathyarchaeia archaeon]